MELGYENLNKASLGYLALALLCSLAQWFYPASNGALVWLVIAVLMAVALVEVRQYRRTDHFAIAVEAAAEKHGVDREVLSEQARLIYHPNSGVSIDVRVEAALSRIKAGEPLICG